MEVSRIKTLWIREPYVTQILTGRKTIEVRVNYPNIQRLQPGDRLRLNNRHLAIIRRIGSYANFEELLAQEKASAIAPDLSPAELLAALRDIYPADKEALGVVALEIAPCRYDAVFFDMGYTLVYFDPPREVIVQEALRTIGAERSIAEIEAALQEVWGSYYQDTALTPFPPTAEYDHQMDMEIGRRFLSHLGLEVDADTLQAYRQARDSWFSRPGVIRPYPEVFDVLTRLQELGYRLGIISNWGWNLGKRVAQVGLDRFFELIWASAYAGYHKPHPEIFRQALTQMDLLPERALYVGDSYQYDVLGARNAGMAVAWVDRNGRADHPDVPVIPDLQGVFHLLGESPGTLAQQGPSR